MGIGAIRGGSLTLTVMTERINAVAASETFLRHIHEFVACDQRARHGCGSRHYFCGRGACWHTHHPNEPHRLEILRWVEMVVDLAYACLAQTETCEELLENGRVTTPSLPPHVDSD